jgi:hypothetical protein
MWLKVVWLFVGFFANFRDVCKVLPDSAYLYQDQLVRDTDLLMGKFAITKSSKHDRK